MALHSVLTSPDSIESLSRPEVQFFDEPPAGVEVPPIAFIEAGSYNKIEETDLPKGMKLVMLSGTGGLICPEDWKVFKDPVPHEGSAATYHVDGFLTPEGDAVFVYILPPDSMTSEHWHLEPLSEEYFWFGGKAYVDGEELTGYAYAPSLSNHQVSTPPESSAMVVAVLKNAGKTARARWHSRIDPLNGNGHIH